MADWVFKLTNVATDTVIADITTLCETAQLQVRLNRPLALTLTLPIDDGNAMVPLNTLQADGDPALFVATRAIKAYRNGVLRAHLLIWNIEYSGTADYSGSITVTAVDPSIKLTARYVYDATGRIADPHFANPISAGHLLKQLIDNAVTNEDLDVGGVTPLRFPIVTTGSITTTQNIWSLINDAPITIGDVLSTITDSGVADIFFDPVESSGGVPVGVMARLRARNSAAAPDKSGSVHFDYGAGAKNVSSARRVIDASTLGNRIYFYVGPRLDKQHWRYLIQGDYAGFESFQAAEFASRRKYGTFMEVRVYDDDADSGAPELAKALWKEEVQLRVNPRDLVYYTPAPGGDNFSQFEPFDDYAVGDIVGISSSSILGAPITHTKQRIYGFNINVDAEGVEQVGELIASADAE